MSRILTVVIALSIITACTRKQSLVVENNTSRDSSSYFKAICYHPVPAGDTLVSWETLDGDLALMKEAGITTIRVYVCLLYTSPSPRDRQKSRMPSSA